MRVGELSLDVPQRKLMITNGTLGPISLNGFHARADHPRDFHGGSLCHHQESLSF